MTPNVLLTKDWFLRSCPTLQETAKGNLIYWPKYNEWSKDCGSFYLGFDSNGVLRNEYFRDLYHCGTFYKTFGLPKSYDGIVIKDHLDWFTVGEEGEIILLKSRMRSEEDNL